MTTRRIKIKGKWCGMKTPVAATTDFSDALVLSSVGVGVGAANDSTPFLIVIDCMRGKAFRGRRAMKYTHRGVALMIGPTADRADMLKAIDDLNDPKFQSDFVEGADFRFEDVSAVICTGCGNHSGTRAAHACPYQIEVKANGDTQYCHCCADCRAGCANAAASF